MVLRTTSWISTYASVVTSPITTTKPVVDPVSQATRERGSCAKKASRIASETWSHSLSGWPSVTDSEVKKSWGDCMNEVGIRETPGYVCYGIYCFKLPNMRGGLRLLHTAPAAASYLLFFCVQCFA